MATRTLGARGTRNQQTRSGRNTSVRSNRMSSHATPRGSAAIGAVSKLAPSGARVGTRNTTIAVQATVRNTRTNEKVGNIRFHAQKTTGFKAPKNMPSKLNNTAASAIASRRYTTASIGTAVGLGASGVGIPLALGLAGTAKATSNANNFASTRLKASGFKVKGSGIGKAKIVKASARQTQRAQKSIIKKESRSRTVYGKKGINAIHTRKSAAKSTTKINSNRTKRNKAKAAGRRFRVRRDSHGRFAGSY